MIDINVKSLLDAYGDDICIFKDTRTFSFIVNISLEDEQGYDYIILIKQYGDETRLNLEISHLNHCSGWETQKKSSVSIKSDITENELKIALCKNLYNAIRFVEKNI